MRFGVLGTAAIARHRFVPAVAATDHELRAIASRTPEKADTVAAEFGVSEAYGSYEALLDSGEVDAVYVPLPNHLHAEWTKRAADRGLHILCEKPLARTAAEAREMGAYCEERDVVLMEALMYRHHPRTERVRDLVREDLGAVRSMHATFHSSLRNWPVGTRMDPDAGGGSLLDVGVYATSAARLFIGEPERVYARSVDRAGTGVDTQVTGLLDYPDGVTAVVACSFDALDAQYYRIEGSEGWLVAEPAFSFDADDATSVTYDTVGGRVTESFDPVDQFVLEIEHFVDCVARGARPLTDATEAARTLAVIDALRESAGADAPVDVQRI